MSNLNKLKETIRQQVFIRPSSLEDAEAIWAVAEKAVDQIVTSTYLQAVEAIEKEVGSFIAGAYALKFDENSREVECWDMWKAGYEQCRKDALNAIKYESRRKN